MGKLLREYQTGESMDSICMLLSLNVKQTRDQKPFLRLELGDTSGRVAAVMWEGFDEEVTKTPVGTVLRIKGTMDEYDERPQVRVSSISIQADGSHDATLLLPATEKDVGSMLDELGRIIGDISYSPLHKLLDVMFGDKDFAQRFAKAPAAKRWHQPYLGGLLEHTLNVHSHAVEMARCYPETDHDLVSGGALIHDIGKTVEYSLEKFFDTSTRGKLIGHLVIGVEILNDYISRLNSLPGEKFPEEVSWHLKHIILSHHGHYEFGSPVVPRTLEALIIHYADDLDAKMSGVLRIYKREQETPGEWTSYVKLMEREFFKPPVLAPGRRETNQESQKRETKKSAPPTPGTSDEEQSLFKDDRR